MADIEYRHKRGSLDVIGHRVPPIDWEARSRGGAGYLLDNLPPNVLHGAILRSPHAYARIESIDTSAAEKMPGVHAVITSADFPKGARYAMERTFDRPPLADGVVRFVGQEVAAVAAETKEQAQAAAAAIRVKYKLVRPPLNIDEALSDGALELHDPAAAGPPVGPPGGPPGAGGPPSGAGGPPPAAPGAPMAGPPSGAPAGGPPPGGPPPGARPAPIANIRRRFRRQWDAFEGGFEKGRADSTASVSARYWFPPSSHVCMETHRTLADWQDGRLHIWSSTATPLPLKMMMIDLLKLDPKDIVVHEVAVGGSFGAKIFITDHEAPAVMLAKKSGRPVVIALSREEEFETTRTRHGFRLDLTLHGDDTGRARALEGSIRVDSGAYLHSGASVMGASMLPLGSLYRFDGLDVEARLVDTSKVPGGAFRGYGGPQTSFALESLMDELAYKVGRDPLQFRIDNAFHSGDEALTAPLGSVGIVGCLEMARDASGWVEKKAHREPGFGIGVAVGEHVSGAASLPGSTRCDGIIDLYQDGRIRVRFGGSDAGTGQKTILAQIASEELGVPLDQVGVLSMDTDETPWDMGAWSSRGTHYTGHGIRHTAVEFSDRLKTLAAERLGEGEIRLEGGFARNERGEQIPLGDLVAISNESRDGMLSHEASFTDETVQILNPFGDGRGKVTATHNYSAHVAEVKVDAKTGKVRVLDYIAANDSGTVMNPTLIEGQISGGVVMGLGGALGEEMIFEQGKMVNPAFLHYAAPRAADVPAIQALHAPHPDPKGPYGAKGVGENGIVPPGPAIANAIFDAVGVRVRALPITPDKIMNGLAEKEGRKRNYRIWARPGRWYIEVVRRMYPMGLLRLLHWGKMRNYAVPAPAAPIKAIEKPKAVQELVSKLGRDAAIMGGGTDLQLRRRQNITAPDRLVSVAGVDEMKQLVVDGTGDIILGAAVTLAEVSNALRERVPGISEAIEEIASPQIRNVATVAGNLAQAKRCWFFRNGFQCYKRTQSATAACYAVAGDHRFYHAVIDGHRCQAVTPSDLATVLVALDAVATIAGPKGERTMPVEKLYTGPGELDVLGERDVIVKITIPAASAARRTSFRKLNLWQGDFAVASAALSVATDDAGNVSEARLCLGAVAPVPWRARKTEKRLVGQPLSMDNLRAILDEELNAHAHPLARNEWKLDAVAGLAEHAAEALA